MCWISPLWTTFLTKNILWTVTFNNKTTIWTVFFRARAHISLIQKVMFEHQLLKCVNLKRLRLLFLYSLMLDYNIVAILNVLILCAFLKRTSNFDNRSEKLVLKLFNDPADDAWVTTSSNRSIIQAITFVDFFIQGFSGGIELWVANAAILHFCGLWW